MAGTKAGGQQAVATNKEKYGEDFYRKIGQAGGRISKGGFTNNPDLARRAGRLGGRAGNRQGVKNGEGQPQPGRHIHDWQIYASIPYATLSKIVKTKEFYKCTCGSGRITTVVKG